MCSLISCALTHLQGRNWYGPLFSEGKPRPELVRSLVQGHRDVWVLTKTPDLVAM